MICLKSLLETLKYQNSKIQLEMNWKVKSLSRNVRTFFVLSREKSPGDDGFTWEFYNCFFYLLGRDLVDSFNSAYNTGEMSTSQRRGVITLVPKEDSDFVHPITLLNLDYKIVSKIIARRIEKVLPLLVCSDQSGFVKGRWRDTENQPSDSTITRTYFHLCAQPVEPRRYNRDTSSHFPKLFPLLFLCPPF